MAGAIRGRDEAASIKRGLVFLTFAKYFEGTFEQHEHLV